MTISMENFQACKELIYSCFIEQKQKNEALNKIMGELNVQDQGSSGAGDDLLDLMDSA